MSNKCFNINKQNIIYRLMLKKYISITIKSLRFFIKKIFYRFGWKIEKIYVQKEANITSPKLIELEILAKCNGILHLGAHRGGEAPIYDWFGKKVIWVEANPKIYFDLKINIEKYINQKSYCYLITDKTGENYDFNISNNDAASSSIYEFGELSVGNKNLWPNKKPLKFLNKINLKSITIDDLIEKNDIDIKLYDHWVMDLQGAELLALKGAKKSLTHCKSIFIEVSDGEVYKEGPNYKEIIKFLDANNLKPTDKIDSRHTNLLFLRK